MLSFKVMLQAKIRTIFTLCMLNEKKLTGNIGNVVQGNNGVNVATPGVFYYRSEVFGRNPVGIIGDYTRTVRKANRGKSDPFCLVQLGLDKPGTSNFTGHAFDLRLDLLQVLRDCFCDLHFRTL